MQSLFDYHNVDPAVALASGAFDPVLGIDTRLFIDPSLLDICAEPELTGSRAAIEEYFNDVLRVIVQIENKGDRLWRAADKLLTFPEVQGICIGYGAAGGHGSGMGPAIRAQLLNTIWEITRAGVNDPALFEIVGAFETNIGPDRISDMVAKVILPQLIAFTQRVCSDLGIPMEPIFVSKNFPTEDMPVNPLTKKAVILVPRGILRDLPIADDFADIAWVIAHNEQLRGEINRMIGASWREATTAIKKKALKTTAINYPYVLEELIAAYKKSGKEPYDFDDDRAGEVIWYRASKDVARSQPLSLELVPNPTLAQVKAVVLQICGHFKVLVENNQLCKLLYDKNGEKKHESAAQLLFFGIASAYCAANNLDLSPESDAGRGPVDFKVSNSALGKVLVEIKLTSNKQLLHGFTNQLPIYMRAEGSRCGMYLVIDNAGASEARMMAFINVVNEAVTTVPDLTVMLVDGVPRPSASVAND